MTSKRSRVDHAKLVEELHARLDERLAALATSDDWLDYLTTARRFHRYSPNNQLLLALQGARGHVASYSTWQQIPARDGKPCQVCKGEKGLAILAPLTAPRIEVDADTGEETAVRRLRGFRTVKVFHEGQLISPPAIDAPVMPELLTGENRWQHVWSAVAGRLEAGGFTVTYHTRSAVDTWNGRTSWANREVLVADDLEPPQALKTLLHEWGHVELDHEHRSGLTRQVKEVEAESVAYLLAQTVGLESGAYSVPYIAVWAHGDLDTIRDAAEQILTTAKRLVDTLEHDLGIELAPDPIHRAIAQQRDGSGTALTEVGTNVIPTAVGTEADAIPVPDAVPESTPDSRIPPGHEALPLPGFPEDPPDRPGIAVEIESRRFLTAMIGDLEPDRRDEFLRLLHDPGRAGDAAAILAESGATATQVARLFDHLGFDTTTIRDALLAPVSDTERPSLFTIVDTRAAIGTIDDSSDLDAFVPLVERTGAEAGRPIESSGRVDDLRVVQRALRRHDQAGKIAALAYGLDLEPATVLQLCRAEAIDPPTTMGIAIALSSGDAHTAYRDVVAAWPDVEGGWERHVHPSLRAKPTLAAVPDDDPTREILDQWMGRTSATALDGGSAPGTPMLNDRSEA